MEEKDSTRVGASREGDKRRWGEKGLGKKKRQGSTSMNNGGCEFRFREKRKKADAETRTAQFTGGTPKSDRRGQEKNGREDKQPARKGKKKKRERKKKICDVGQEEYQYHGKGGTCNQKGGVKERRRRLLSRGLRWKESW